MVLGPRDFSKLGDEDRKLLVALEKQIDAFLLDKYSGAGSAHVILSPPVDIGYPLRQELRDRYRSAGWLDVRFKGAYDRTPRTKAIVLVRR